MRIYKVNFESKKWGSNWSCKKVAASTCEVAIRKAKKGEPAHVRVESVELLASTD